MKKFFTTTALIFLVFSYSFAQDTYDTKVSKACVKFIQDNNMEVTVVNLNWVNKIGDVIAEENPCIVDKVYFLNNSLNYRGLLEIAQMKGLLDDI